MSIKSISLEATSEVFSAHSGQKILNDLWKSLKLDNKFKFCLPRKKRNKGLTQINKFKALVFSFAVGNDCLADIDTLNRDKLFRELIGGTASSSCMGDFLRKFDKRHIERLQEALVEATLELRLAMFPEDKKFVLTMDSTPHEHYAKKMEGLAWNYKDMWCLDSQNAYDQYGLSYLFDLRPGNTFSGNDSELWVHEIFKKVQKTSLDLWFRADSAYSKHVMLRALAIKNVKFVIALKNDIGSYVRRKNKNLLTWKKTKLRFFDSEECEVAMALYPIKQLGTLRVVFIRAPKKDTQLNLLEDIDDGYDYYSLVTNVSAFEMNEVQIIDFYRQRSTAENYVREQKYGFDFLNFPCQKLKANKAFGLAGTIAHNLTRTLSFMMEQKVKTIKNKRGSRQKVVQLGYYAKKVRSELINIAGKVTCSARKAKVRINNSNWEVLRKIMEKIKNLQQRYVPYKTLSELFENRIEGTTS